MSHLIYVYLWGFVCISSIGNLACFTSGQHFRDVVSFSSSACLCRWLTYCCFLYDNNTILLSKNYITIKNWRGSQHGLELNSEQSLWIQAPGSSLFWLWLVFILYLLVEYCYTYFIILGNNMNQVDVSSVRLIYDYTGDCTVCILCVPGLAYCITLDPAPVVHWYYLTCDIVAFCLSDWNNLHGTMSMLDANKMNNNMLHWWISSEIFF